MKVVKCTENKWWCEACGKPDCAVINIRLDSGERLPDGTIREYLCQDCIEKLRAKFLQPDDSY